DDDDASGYRTDDYAGPRLDIARGGGDRDERRDGSVSDHADVHRLGDQVDGDQGRDRTARGGEVGDHDHVSEMEVGRVESRPWVEAEPPEPEDQHAELSQGHV